MAQPVTKPKATMFIAGHEHEACPPNVRKIIDHINLPKKILNLIVGKNHPMWSRLLIGLLIMCAAELIPEKEMAVRIMSHFTRDTGGIPWLEAVIAFANSEIA